MTCNECINLIKSDLRRITVCNFSNIIKNLITSYSFIITFWFRIGTYLSNKKNILYKLILFFVKIIYKHNQYKTGIQLPLGTKVAKGLNFAHFSCIVINHASIIGENCTIFQGVTIGSKRGRNGGAAKIGNNVVIASGAKIIGNVLIGNNVMIGANSVVVKDIPDNAVVAGNPAQIINYNGKYHTELYIKINE